ncbi:MAG: hypothetical protein JWO46_299 [Nocardioidaceae bacterium]|nr:hypothetical protein [Nocardioidaceae bacterium]
MKRLHLLVAATAAAAVVLGATPQATVAAAPRTHTAAAPGRLTNLAHLDFLGDTVTPPSQAGHTTYQLAQRPGVGTLWTYADHRDGGTFARVGGGTYDAATNTYGQGAFNADDMARAAVVYVRDWKQTGSTHSRDAAFQMLRGLTYLQTTSGPHAGNVVLWMQPDGTLHPSADPVELPDPSDSDASYWLARSVWALGEGYAAFRTTDPEFAGFLRQRLDLAVSAIDRQVLSKDGQFLQVDGRRTPAWLIAQGADASAEAVLGLVAYVRAGGSGPARHTLARLSDGIAQLSGGDARTWPFGGVLPWALSRSDWHAWSSQMPAALAGASDVLGDRSLGRTAARDSFTFDPWMLTSGGTDNGRLPTRVDANQIAYGADSRVQSLIATGGAGDQLAGVVASWFFGNNASHAPTYDPATGVTFDGVAPDGTVNLNSGAESTIHGLLTMLALDAHPGIRRIAETASVRERVAPTVVEAEGGTLSGNASVVTPASLWTDESQYGGTGYASLRGGSTATFDLGAHPDALLMPVVDLQHGTTGATTFTASGRRIGVVHAGDVGPSGDSAGPGALLPVTLPKTVRAGSRTITATTTGDETRLDALMLQPLVTRLVLGGDGHGTALLRSAAATTQHTRVSVPGSGTATIRSYDGQGRLVSTQRVRARVVPVRIVPGGFVLVRR